MTEPLDRERAPATFDRTLAVLLAMAMFVLVVDTSLMNVSISSVVHDLGTTVSKVQAAISLEALVSAAVTMSVSSALVFANVSSCSSWSSRLLSMP